MIKFDSTSIKERILERIQQNPDWKAVSNHSVVEALVKSNAEALAEISRYVEYLFKESKWDSAQNESSILSMASMLGYKPKRKISATGKIYVSNNPKIKLVGKTISLSTFKDLENKGTSINWSPTTSDYLIKNSTEDLNNLIKDELGNTYVTQGGILSKGEYYTVLPVVQGSLKRVESLTLDVIRSTAVTSKIDPYLYLPVLLPSCEDASSTSTKGFFSVKAVYENKVQEYRIVDSLLFSSSSDYDVEVSNDPYTKNLFYLRFNNNPNRGNILNISNSSSLECIQIDYLHTKGSEGNLLDTYKSFTLQDANGNNLYGINIEAISGGKSEEGVSDIKVNAPKYYLTSYSAGTKEAYEKLISSLEFSIEGYSHVFKPRKVQVYGSTELTGNGYSKPITCVSFLDSALEDISSSSTSDSSKIYDKITLALNSYLGRLKSPQDTLIFKAPNYVSFAVGVEWTADESSVIDKNSTSSDIRDFIEEAWGSNSEDLDFQRSFYKSDLLVDLGNNFGENIHFGDVEIEAIKKLDWGLAERKSPRGDELSSSNSTIIHTCRIPFSFNSIFYGNKSIKGFKDYRDNSNYVMRVDFMYKYPSSLTKNSNSYHTSLFIPGPGVTNSGNYNNFYVKNDSKENISIWNTSGFSSIADYKNLANAHQVSKAYQVDYREKVYTDNDFKELLDNINSSKEKTLESYLSDRIGVIDSYLIYFSSNYEEGNSTIGDGFLEITFDSLYNTLKTFSSFDTNLRNDLYSCSLSLLKCGSMSSAGDAFSKFIDILKDYVDIYICMRPQDSDLIIGSSDSVNKNIVLYIDSYDSSLASQSYISNLSNVKRARMISVNNKEY